VTEIDFKRRAERFHRRAQVAEAALVRAVSDSAFWLSCFDRSANREAGLSRQLIEARKELARRRLRDPDPLQRIIEIGKLFP
jgi:hypothetical protein